MPEPKRIHELLATTAGHLQDLLSADLNLGFTFATLAKTEEELGDIEALERCKRNAQHAIDMVSKLEELLPPGRVRKSILARRSELERIVAAL